MRRTIALLSIVTIIFSSLTIVHLIGYRTDGTLIWDYESLKLYVLVSIAIFGALNAFRKIEITFTKENARYVSSNLSGLYGYILGTLIYFIVGLLTLDYLIRVLSLIIPIFTTIIGFNFSKKANVEIKSPKRKLLIIMNVILLTFWSLILVDLQSFLNYRRSVFKEDRKYFEKIDSQFQKRSDSMANVIFKKLDTKTFKKLNNDTLESVIIGQLNLYSEFSRYRDANPLTSDWNEVFLFEYKEMNTMLIVGFIAIVFLNAIYILYSIRDEKATPTEKVHAQSASGQTQ